MTKAYCYLNQKLIDQLEAIKLEEGHESSSQTMKEMIALGIKIYLHNKENFVDESEQKRLEKEAELNKQHTTHLLRLLGITADIFRCVFDADKLQEPSKNADEHIAKLKVKVGNSIEMYLAS